MNYRKNLGKVLTLGLLFGGPIHMEAQYLERIYDYIENLSVFEENQEEGLTWFKVAASNGNKWAAEIIAKINGKMPPEA